MPNTVFTGTAIAVIVRVSQNADWNAGRWMALMTGSMPPSNVRQKIMSTGSARMRSK